MQQLIRATSTHQLETLNKLAWEILMPFYEPNIPVDHIEYFLEHFLSVEAMQQNQQTNFRYWLLLLDQVPVGFLALEFLPDLLMLSKLYILEQARGHGLGRMAMELTHKEAAAAGLPAVHLFVSEHNHEGIAIYKHYGYEVQVLETHCFPNGHSVRDWLMVKKMG